MKNKDKDQDDSKTFLNEYQAKQLLKQYQIPVIEEQLAADEEQTLSVARNMGYPVVVKGVGAAIQHKTERNLVHLNLSDEAAVRRACAQVRRHGGKGVEGFLVQPWIAGQREFMAGMFRDACFGPVVLFGLGGVLAEALEDVVLRLAPLTEADARQMIAEIQANKLLGPFRGEAPVEQDAIVRTLLGLSRLAMEDPSVAEVDLNPLKVTPEGQVLAVDALVARGRPSTRVDPAKPTVAPKDLYLLFHPRSIAFVGASAGMGKWGHLLVVNTIYGGYKGRIYLVNPKGGTIAGQPVFRNLEEIPGDVDLAVVTIPAEGTLALMDACRRKNIRYMVLITSGFGETGQAGKALEIKLVKAACKAGVILVGPNTMGITNPHINLFCTGSTVMPLAGDTAMLSQSGNMGTQLLAFAEKQGIGIRAFAGSGNEAMITIEDALKGFEEDPQTRTVLLYVESVKDGQRFFNTARRICRKKPIVLLKGGQTRAGQRAAASHTGAMTSDSRIFNAMCRQAGIVKVNRPMDLLDLAAAFSSLPLPRGTKTAIMTWGGGWGVVTADLCQQSGLDVPALDDALIAKIDQCLPPYWSRTNPVDMVGERNPEAAIAILELLMAWEGCDAVINLGMLGRRLFMERFGAAVEKADPTISKRDIEKRNLYLDQFEQRFLENGVRLMGQYQKPLIGVSLLSDSRQKTVSRFGDAAHKAVCFETPERAVNALARMVRYKQFIDMIGKFAG